MDSTKYFTKDSIAFIKKELSNAMTLSNERKFNILGDLCARALQSDTQFTIQNVKDVFQLIKEAFAVDTLDTELKEITARENMGHVDPDLVCSFCGAKACISKQIHDRLGGDEGASRYVYCTECKRTKKN